MSETSFLQALVAGLRRGDDEAAQAFVERFGAGLIAKARAHLSKRARGTSDSQDVAQSVMWTFIRRIRDEDYELKTPKSLWSLLVTITIRKCCRLDQLAGRRREQPLPGNPNQSGLSWSPVDSEPTPSEAAMLEEQVEKALSQLSNEKHRLILQLRLQGYTVPEISKEVQRSEHLVKWVLKEARKRLEFLRDQPEP